MNWLFSVMQLVLFSELKTYNMTSVAWFTIKWLLWASAFIIIMKTIQHD